ncbi:hypothetical protein HYE67_005595 [Fusarium culmorum]|uniref:Uncharacterized protein n=1 Tax=Fusarium culmorum TaxID=5516 RepID=A0A7S8D7E1_FUSCU|nr:hypothetical protein HYE67_005595 [Fusarium culmorum]
MAILLVTSPPAEVIGVSGMLDGVVLHTDLYKATEALFAVVSGHNKAHTHLVQTQGLIALYEFGTGSFEQAHITLTSAIAMANLVKDYTVDLEAKLTWKLCLITLDRMITMSTHSRLCKTLHHRDTNQLPLICNSNHPLTMEVEHMLINYNYPQYKRKLEEAIRRLLAMHEGVARAGRFLQRDEGKGENPLYDPVPDFELDIEWNEESGRKRTVGLDEDKRAMMDDNGNPKAPNYWSGHDPQVLSLSAMLVNEYYNGRPKDGQLTDPRWDRPGWRGKCEDVALEACAAVITMFKKKEVDIKQLSMVSMFCIMHNLTIIVKDLASDFAVQNAKDFELVMEEFAARWPFAQVYLQHLTRFMIIAEDLHEVRHYH